MLVCEAPGPFYRALHHSGLLGRSPRILGLVDWALAPTQVRLSLGPSIAKASVVSVHALERETSAGRRDQFMAGRLFQDVHIVWERDARAGEIPTRAIASARELTLDWAAPDLAPRFDAADYVRQLFRTSFRFEVRPETRSRADALFSAQAARLVPIFTSLLASWAIGGRLTSHSDGTYSLPRSPGVSSRVRRRLFLEWSRLRATARWPKHAVTFDGWLDYIVRKAERHSGETIVLSPLERRFPFIFLWPRVFQFLSRQRRKGRAV